MPYDFMSDSYRLSPAILWHVAFGFKELKFLIFVFIFSKIFVFIFRVLRSESEAVPTQWCGTLGQQDSFQSQIGGNCD
jgi:hypothetical protein